MTAIVGVAQPGPKTLLSGNVETSDHEPLAFATVSLENTLYQTLTDERGNFEMRVPDGKYTLIISYAGYASLNRKIVLEGDSRNLGILEIAARSNELKEVIVSDILTNKFAKKTTISPSRMPLGDLETPTVYNMVNKDFLQELAATDFNTAFASVAGTVANEAVNGSGQSITMRGFTSPASFRNGLVVNPRTQTEVYNLDRIEVMKGPAGTLFGGPMGSYSGAMSTYGGVVNSVTKKPFESYRGEVSYTTGSWGLNRITADVNTPLNKDHTALARFNTLFTSQGSFQDAGVQRALGASAAFQFKASEKTTVSFDAEIYVPTKNLNGYVRNAEILSDKSMEQFSDLYYRSFSSNDIATTRMTYYAGAELKHRFNDRWMSVTSFQRGESNEKESIFMVLSYLNDNEVRRQIRPFDVLNTATDNIQQNFIGDFKIGQMRNRLVVGANYAMGKNFTQNAVFDVNGRNSVFVPYDDISLAPNIEWTPVSLAKVQKINQSRKSTQATTDKFSTLSAYASDVLNITPKLLVMGSLRVDHYQYYNTVSAGIKQDDAFDQLQLSPKIGVVYQPVKDKVALFANYVNGFTNLPPSPNDEGVLQIWKPEQANQMEGGVKLNLFDNRLNATVSYYDIRVTDLVRYIDDFTEVQDGDLDSKGVEVEIVTSPLRGWNLVAGYGYNDNKYHTYDDEYVDKQAQWTPKQTASLWTSYKFLSGPVRGLGFGAGFNYTDKVFMSIANKFYVPEHTIVNGTVFFDQPKYRLGLKLNNVFDKKYWNFYGQPQKPREILASFSFKF